VLVLVLVLVLALVDVAQTEEVWRAGNGGWQMGWGFRIVA
jgi:hypothetical protein